MYLVSDLPPPTAPVGATYPGTATAALRTAVETALDTSPREPLGYTFAAPELLATGYLIVATVFYFPTDDLTELQAQVRAAAHSFIDDHLYLGRDIHQSRLVSALLIDGVDHVTAEIRAAGTTTGVALIAVATSAFASCRKDTTDVDLTFTATTS